MARPSGHRSVIAVGGVVRLGDGIVLVRLTYSRHRGKFMFPGGKVDPGESLEEALAAVDYVVVMSVNPGWGGQRFIEGSMDRVRQVRRLAERHNPSLEIVVDGGINASRVAAARDAGADVLVAGSAVFGASDPAAAVREMLAA